MSRHVACRHADQHECTTCDTSTHVYVTPDSGTWIDVIRHGGAHRAQPVSLVKDVA